MSAYGINTLGDVAHWLNLLPVVFVLNAERGSRKPDGFNSDRVDEVWVWGWVEFRDPCHTRAVAKITAVVAPGTQNHRTIFLFETLMAVGELRACYMAIYYQKQVHLPSYGIILSPPSGVLDNNCSAASIIDS